MFPAPEGECLALAHRQPINRVRSFWPRSAQGVFLVRAQAAKIPFPQVPQRLPGTMRCQDVKSHPGFPNPFAPGWRWHRGLCGFSRSKILTNSSAAMSSLFTPCRGPGLAFHLTQELAASCCDQISVLSRICPTSTPLLLDDIVRGSRSSFHVPLFLCTGEG